jgi:hypothetical protein
MYENPMAMNSPSKRNIDATTSPETNTSDATTSHKKKLYCPSQNNNPNRQK